MQYYYILPFQKGEKGIPNENERRVEEVNNYHAMKRKTRLHRYSYSEEKCSLV